MTVDQARREFPHTWSKMVYLNHAAISPMTFRVRDAVDKYLTRRALKGIEPYPWALKMSIETKELFANMINAKGDDIAFVLNTSDGLNVVAEGLDWRPGDRILLNDLEFPANLYPFLNLKRMGVEIDVIKTKDYKVTIEDIASNLTDRTKLVSISHVQFSTGAKADLTAIGKLCRAKNILFAVDAIQSLPHCKLDVVESCIDFLATGSHKWLMAPEGTGMIYAGARAIERIHQSNLGWTSVSEPFNFADIDPERLRSGAGRFENGTLNYVGISGLNAALKFFNEFGLPEMERSVLDLSGYLIDRLDRQGVEVLTPKSETERAGIVSFKFKDAEATHARLLKSEVVISLRSGYLRAAPHFYNTEEDIRKLLVALFD